MSRTPFGTPIDPDFYEKNEDVQDLHSSLEDKLREADYEARWFDYLSKYDKPDDDDTHPKGSQQSPTQDQGSSAKARRLSGLTLQVVESKRLLMTKSGQAYFYQEYRGGFQPTPKVEIYLSEFFPSETVSNLLSRDLREIAERLTWDGTIRCDLDDFNHDPHVVNLENGVFNIASAELMAHDPSFRFTYQIHAWYVEGEVSFPAFDWFCQTSLDDNPAKRRLLLEFIGYICIDTNDGKCALFFKGQPNRGKSVMCSFISRLFDKEVVSNIPLHQLGDRFFRAELAGKKLNVAGEIAGCALQDISIFKSITGNDRIAGEFKGCKPFYFTPRCKMLFSGNTLPLTTEVDATAAFVNRIRVLLFNSSTPPEKQDKQLLNKLWEERDAIVMLALDAVRELIKRGFEFTLPEDSKQFLDSLTMRGNVIQAFIDESYVLGPNERVFNTELYAAFEAFCKRDEMERLSRTKFYELMSGIPHVTAKRIRIGTDNRQGHVGIALKKKRPTAELWNKHLEAVVPQGFCTFQPNWNVYHYSEGVFYLKKSTETIRPLFLTAEQAGRASGLGVNRIRQLMEDGRLEYLPVGNRKLTTVKALLDYYQREKVSAK